MTVLGGTTKVMRSKGLGGGGYLVCTYIDRYSLDAVMLETVRAIKKILSKWMKKKERKKNRHFSRWTHERRFMRVHHSKTWFCICISLFPYSYFSRTHNISYAHTETNANFFDQVQSFYARQNHSRKHGETVWLLHC